MTLDTQLSRSNAYPGGVFILNREMSHFLKHLDNGDVLKTLNGAKDWFNIKSPLAGIRTPNLFKDFFDPTINPISFNVYNYHSPDPENFVLLDMDMGLIFGSAIAGWPHKRLGVTLNSQLGDHGRSWLIHAREEFNKILKPGVQIDKYNLRLPTINIDSFSNFETNASALPGQYRDRYLNKISSQTMLMLLMEAKVAKWHSKAALIRAVLDNAYRMILGLPLRPVFFIIDAILQHSDSDTHSVLPSGIDESRARVKGSIQVGSKSIKTITDAELRMVYKLSHEHPSPIMRRAAQLSLIPLRLIRTGTQSRLEGLPHLAFFGGESGLPEWLHRIRTRGHESYIEREETLNPRWVQITTEAILRMFQTVRKGGWRGGLGGNELYAFTDIPISPGDLLK